jgi:hypothetical protein
MALYAVLQHLVKILHLMDSPPNPQIDTAADKPVNNSLTILQQLATTVVNPPPTFAGSISLLLHCMFLQSKHRVVGTGGLASIDGGSGAAGFGACYSNKWTLPWVLCPHGTSRSLDSELIGGEWEGGGNL